MAALWFEERTDPPVWHLAVARGDGARYRMACGWEYRLASAGRLWPQKTDELGPRLEERCYTCTHVRREDVP